MEVRRRLPRQHSRTIGRSDEDRDCTLGGNCPIGELLVFPSPSGIRDKWRGGTCRAKGAMNSNYSNRGLQTLTALSRLGPVRPNATYTKPRPNPAVGALIISPAAAQEKLGEVNTQVSTLDTEIKLNVQRPEFLKAWGEFKDNWQKFYDDHQSTLKILLTGTGTIDRKANEYQGHLTAWYTALKTENPSARLVFPPPLPPTAPPDGPSVPWWGVSLLTLAGTGVLAYISYASYVYAKEAQAKRRFIEERVVPAVLEARAPALSGFYPAFPRSAGQAGGASRKVTHPDSMTRVHPGSRRDHSAGTGGNSSLSRQRRDEVLGDGEIDWNWSPSKHFAQREAERERERDSDPAFGGASHDYDD
jgi:hypothetical protein